MEVQGLMAEILPIRRKTLSNQSINHGWFWENIGFVTVLPVDTLLNLFCDIACFKNQIQYMDEIRY